MLTAHPSNFIMASTLGYWTIASIVVGLLALLPSIMGLFSKNKFNVKGKVRGQLPNLVSLV